jgi:hypothetical protein
MRTATVRIIGGVDTHGQSHHAAVIDGVGRQLDDREFPASPAGYGALLEWLCGYGGLDRVGVEGTVPTVSRSLDISARLWNCPRRRGSFGRRGPGRAPRRRGRHRRASHRAMGCRPHSARPAPSTESSGWRHTGRGVRLSATGMSATVDSSRPERRGD